LPSPIASQGKPFGLQVIRFSHKRHGATEAQVQKLLGFATRDALDGFLKAHEVWLGYSAGDLERERAALRRLVLASRSALSSPMRHRCLFDFG
jgi:hypothetical protein